jgi:dUTP pyrophosphatase
MGFWKLLIIDDNEFLKNLYNNQISKTNEKFKNHLESELDSGFDLYIPECHNSSDGNWTVKGNSTIFIPLGIKLVRYLDNTDNCKYSLPYMIHPRSSIWKNKPIRLANSTGIIDAGYRGELGVALDNIRPDDFTIEKGIRVVQACSPDLRPFSVTFTNSLNTTLRGENGFGSTGR